MTHEPTGIPQQGHVEVSSWEWIGVWRRAVIPWEFKALGLLLATYADADGSRIRPGVKRLTAETGKSDKTVRRWLEELRSTYGVIAITERGGGRGGRGKTHTYRLVLPADLLDRIELLPPDGSYPQPPESPVTQVTAQSPVTVPRPRVSPVTQTTGENDFHRSNDTVTELMTGQIRGMTGHLDDRLPTTSPTTTDQPQQRTNRSRLPAQPQTARAAGPKDDDIETIIEEIKDHTGATTVPRDHARRVYVEVLARTKRMPASPLAYVLAAIRREPSRYRPVATPPAVQPPLLTIASDPDPPQPPPTPERRAQLRTGWRDLTTHETA